MQRLPLLFAALLMIAPAGAQTETPGPRPAQQQKKEKDRPDTPIEKAMDRMGAAFRNLRRQARAGQFAADAMALVAIMQGAAAEAKKHEPLKAKELPEADRAKLLANFQAQLDKFMAELDLLAAELKDGKTAEAAKRLEKLTQLQRSGHRDFQPKDY